MSSDNPINDYLTSLTAQNKTNDEPVKTFFDAQLAYAKSKHSKAEKRKKANYKKVWYAKRGGSK